jgi:hypothetical protein
MVNTRNSFNRPKTRTIHRHFKAQFSNLIAAATLSLRRFYKLAITINADMILFPPSVAILANML